MPARLAAAFGAGLWTLVLALTGCVPHEGGDGAGGENADGATFTLGLTAAPASLDYTSTGGAAIVQALLGNVYEGLVALDEDGTVVPLLATGYTVSEDGLRYVFTLREGVSFHDGTPLTPEAVVASLERLPEWTANSPGTLAAVESVEVTGPNEVTLRLREPDHDVLFRLAGPLGTIFAPALLADPTLRTTHPVGTGPFVFVGYEPGTRLDLARYDSYWGQAAGVDRVALRYVTDPNAAVAAVRTGGVDALFGAEAYDLVRTLEGRDGLTVTVGTTQGVVVVSMNPDGPADGAALADPRVREAITRAIDRDAVVHVATAGFGTPLAGPAVPTDPYARGLVTPYPYDPQRSVELLEEAGADDLRLVMTVPNRGYALASAQVVQAQLREVGVSATLEQQEFPALWLQQTMVNHDFDLTVVNHVEPKSLWGYADPAYYWSYDSGDVRADLARALAATSEPEYDSAVRDAVVRIMADAPGVWLYNPPNLVVARDGVRGLPRNDLGVGIALAGVRVDGGG